jgi:hypothetical protein
MSSTFPYIKDAPCGLCGLGKDHAQHTARLDRRPCDYLAVPCVKSGGPAIRHFGPVRIDGSGLAVCSTHT